ncbi:5'-nucleotidase, partial [Vibrio parahaemolyticus]
MTLGNHEFVNQLYVLFKQQDWANCPMLSANIYDKKTGKRLFKPYEIFTKQRIIFAVIGLTTEDTATFGNPEFIGPVDIRGQKEEAQ